MVKKVFYILLPVAAVLVVFIMFISCQFTVSTPDLPVLKMPGDKAENVSLYPEFKWGKKSDDDTLYSLNLYGITNGGTDLVLTIPDLEGTGYKLSEELQPSRKYAWEIRYKDKRNKEFSSGLNTFTTKPLPELELKVPLMKVLESNTLNVDLKSFLKGDDGREIVFLKKSGPGKISDGMYVFDTGYEDSGEYIVEVQVKDEYRTHDAQFEVRVDDNYRPARVKDIQESFEVDQGDLIRVDLKDKIINPESSRLNYTVAEGPGEIEDGVYILRADFTKSGRQHVKIIIEDPATQLELDFHVFINDINRSPMPGFIPMQSLSEDVPFELDLRDYIKDPDGDLLTFKKTMGPGELSEDGIYKFKPDYDASGEYKIHFEANDGLGSLEDSFLLSVANVNRKPFSIKGKNSNSYVLREGETFTMKLTEIYTDPDDDVLSFRLVQGPGYIQDDEYIYTPDHDSQGEDEIILEIDDGQDIILKRYAFVIEDVNRPPVIEIKDFMGANSTVTRDEFSINWIASDPDSDSLSQNIYFSQNNPPEIVERNYIGKTWSPFDAGIRLEPDKNYFWKLEVIDERSEAISTDIYTVKFENKAPKKPLITTKTHEIKSIGLPYVIKWVSSDDDDFSGHTYSFYLGESQDELKLVAGGLTQEEYVLEELEKGKEYFWKVGVRDPYGKTSQSQIQSLKVKLPPNPPVLVSNQTGTPFFSSEPVLKWEQPLNDDNCKVFFDVYLGISEDALKIVAKDIEETNFTPQGLRGAAHYFWKVVAKDSYGESAAGPIWDFKTDFGAGALQWSFKAEYDIRSSPAISDEGIIYFGADDYYLYAINQYSELMWRFNCGNVVSSSPSIGPEGNIYIAAGNKYIYALNPEGKELWKKRIEGACYSSPAINKDGVLYIGDSTGTLHAISKKGETLWTYKVNDEIRSSPSVGLSGTIYFGSDDKNIYALNPDGTLKWKFETDGFVRSSPALDTQETLYVGSFDGSLYALNKNGALLWKRELGAELRGSPSVYLDGTVYIGAFDGNLHAIDVNGIKKWSYKIDEGPFWSSSPAIGEDSTVYVGTWEKKIIAIDSDGRLKWEYKADDYIKSSPVIDKDGSLYIGTYGANLLSIFTQSKGLSEDSPWPMFRKNAKHTASQ